MKKEHTKWYYRVDYKGDHYIRVGFIHNKKSRCRYDVIRIQSKGVNGVHDTEWTIDEAMVVVHGIIIIATRFFLGGMPKRLIKFMRIG